MRLYNLVVPVLAFTAATTLATRSARAQATLLIDTAPQPTNTLVNAPTPPDGATGGGLSVHIQTSTNISITRLECEIDTTPTGAGNLKFVIWDVGTGQVVYQSPTQTVTANQAAKFFGQDIDTNAGMAGNQPFLAVGGGDYQIAMMHSVSGGAKYYFDASTTENQNGIETRADGGMQNNFASPKEPPNAGILSDARCKIYGFLDFDVDGISNNTDNCPIEPNPGQEDKDSDGLGDVCDGKDDRDFDSDGIFNDIDNCPTRANPGQDDKDSDGLGDACDSRDDRDLDSDGIFNDVDNCPTKFNPGQEDMDGDGDGDVCDPQPTVNDKDFDGDGVLNLADNCPFDANSGQEDEDDDGLGNECDDVNDKDFDRDTILNEDDNCPFDANTDQKDIDGDGLGDACDPMNNGNDDPDGDGVPNAEDNCPFAANKDQKDSDGDGIGDQCDLSILVRGSGCSTSDGGSGAIAFLIVGLFMVVRRRRNERR